MGERNLVGMPPNHDATGARKKAAPRGTALSEFGAQATSHFLLPLAAAKRFSSIAAWAAARRATGTRKGEQLT